MRLAAERIEMNKSMILSFNSLLVLTFALCTSAVLTPPAQAETCMTDSLMMVYEPVETVKPRPKKVKSRVSVAHHKIQSQSNHHAVQRTPHEGDTMIQASKSSSTKQVAGKEADSNQAAGDAT